ncbi:MAG: DUF1080 domain-containing protein [Phycisphaerales bacterium]
MVIACIVALLSVRSLRAAGIDPFMGDWQGDGKASDGQLFNFVAQVIALGDSQYQLNVLQAFDQGGEPMHIMNGSLQGSTYTYTADGGKYRGKCALDGEICKGWYKGDADGQFEMRRVSRRPPTLGAKPPAGAVVLFDGTNFDKWVGFGARKGAINIIEAIGNAQDAAAYLKASVWSPNTQKATLQLGTDDGVKVWLNGKMVHANNASRGVMPDEDKVPVTLQQGVNELLLKVTNGSGDWGAIARFVGEGGKPLENINEISPQFADARGSNEYLRPNGGFLTQWQIAGPYQEAGRGAEAILDVAFAPENAPGSKVSWKWVNANDPDSDRVKWPIVDGAMEIKAGSGNIVTKAKFKDFRLHIEFRTPFMPQARGQGRGNSGVYLQGRYEIQVLDSYGLEGLDNECGGIYKVGAPMVNMCLPPLQWQTYDITFQAPRFDASGSKIEDAAVTVVHNGVTIHDRRRLPGPTGGAMDDNVSEPGGIYLQDHGNPVQFRNIWLVETK